MSDIYSLIILKRKLVILNLFQDLPRLRTKPNGVLKQVQNDVSFSRCLEWKLI